MAKKEMATEAEVEAPPEEIQEVSAPKTGGKGATKKVVVKMGIREYFKTFDPNIHIYTRAALEIEFHDIMKSETEWKEALKEHTEGA